MRFLKVLSSVVFSIIIIIAIVGYFAVRNFDLNRYKPYIQDLVKSHINRELAINGEAQIGISLIPTLVLNDVELSNPAWAAQPQMIRVSRIEVKFAVLPLLKKQIVIDKVSLLSPEIYLEKTADGINNWTFDSKSDSSTSSALSSYAAAPANSASLAQASGTAALAGFAARNVLIENGIVSYLDGTKETTLIINQITMTVPSVNDNINASFNLNLDGQDIKGKLQLGSINTLLTNQEPFPFTLTVKALGIDADINGSAADIMTSPRYALQANIYNPAGNLNAPETMLKTFVDGDTKQAAVDIQTLNIVNNLITGKVKAAWSGKLPLINLNLQSAKLNLQNFNSNSTFTQYIPELISSAQATTLVPDTKVPYSLLKMLNATAKIDITKLIIDKGMEAENVNLNANLQNGILKINPLTLDFGGGEITTTLTADANKQSVILNLTSQNMQLQNLHQEFKVTGKNDFGVISGGKVDIYADVNTTGTTYRQLVQNLKGSTIAIVDQSTLQTGGLEFLTGGFVSELLKALGIDTNKSKQMDLTCAVVRADLGNGEAKFPKGIALNSKQLTLVSDGNINLLNDKIDFSIKPFSGKVVDTNVVQALSSFLKVKGTLQSPKLVLDDKETIKTIVGVATTGGVAYLGSKLALDADSSPCYTALQGTKYSSRFPKPTGVKATTQKAYQGTSEEISKDLKTIGNQAKGLLKSLKASIKSNAQ